MARDLIIDAPSGDLVLVGGDLVLTASGLEDTRQRLQVKLEIERGTWILDTTLGVPWVGEILGPARAPSLIAAQLRVIVAQTPGIVRVERCVADLDRVTGRLSFDVVALVARADGTTQRVGATVEQDDDGTLALLLAPLGGY